MTDGEGVARVDDCTDGNPSGIRKLISIFLIMMVGVVVLNLILTPVYHDGSPGYPVTTKLYGRRTGMRVA